MEIEQKIVLKAAREPRSEWAQLALEAAERIEALKKGSKAKEKQPETVDTPEKTRRIRACCHSEN